MGTVTPFIPKNSPLRLQRVKHDGTVNFFIVDPAIGIFPEAQAFIRELTKWRSSHNKTVRGIAYIIIDWCNYLRDNGLWWYQATDQNYIDWMKSQKFGKKRLGRKNRVVWRWYKYLYEHSEYKHQALSVFESISLPTDAAEFGKPRYSPPPEGAGERDPEKARKSKTFLSDETVDTLVNDIANLPQNFINERDGLIVAYEKECGLRAIGISDIRVSSFSAALSKVGIIPKYGNILKYATDKAGRAQVRRKVAELAEFGSHGVQINVVEKFSKSRDVLLNFDVIYQTLDFLWKYHDRWKKKGSSSYRSKVHLFISLKTGEGLLSSTVADIVKRRFNNSNLDGSGHDLRRYRITQDALDMVKANKKAGKLFDNVAIEVALADKHGHDDFVTMRPYVNMARIMDSIEEEVIDHYER